MRLCSHDDWDAPGSSTPQPSSRSKGAYPACPSRLPSAPPSRRFDLPTACSDVDDRALGTCGGQQSPNVISVVRHDIGSATSAQNRDRSVHDIFRASLREQRTGLVGCSFVEVDHLTAAQQTSHLNLRCRTTRLRDDRCRHHRDEPSFQTNAVLRPDAPFVPVGGDQDPGVVNHLLHRLARFRRVLARAKRVRASANSL